MQLLEREITREQAMLLFDLPEDGVKTYQLRLVPKSVREVSTQKAVPFATEQEAEEFTARLSRKLIHEAR